MKKIIAILMMCFLSIVASAQYIEGQNSNSMSGNIMTTSLMVGNDKDEHGCIGSAGYTWSEEKSQCIRTWEENIQNTAICTEDAKQCSDGSFVGRTGPNCEFVCPGETKIKDTRKACTREYMPVCAEVKVQCIQAPCPAIKETFSNKCEMENNSLATFLHAGTCESPEDSVEINEEVLMCPMNYMPVCGNDGKTYGNACTAGKVGVQYEGICVSTKYQKAVYHAWQNNIEKRLQNLSEEKSIKVLNTIISRTEKLASKENFESQKGAILNYILHLARTSLKSFTK